MTVKTGTIQKGSYMKSLLFKSLYLSVLFAVGLSLQGCPGRCQPAVEYVDRPVEVYVPVACQVTLPEPPEEANTTAETSLNIKKYIILFRQAVKSCVKPLEE